MNVTAPNFSQSQDPFTVKLSTNLKLTIIISKPRHFLLLMVGRSKRSTTTVNNYQRSYVMLYLLWAMIVIFYVRQAKTVIICDCLTVQQVITVVIGDCLTVWQVVTIVIGNCLTIWQVITVAIGDCLTVEQVITVVIGDCLTVEKVITVVKMTVQLYDR